MPDDKYVPSWGVSSARRKTKLIASRRESLDSVTDTTKNEQLTRLQNRIIALPIPLDRKGEIPFHLPHTSLVTPKKSKVTLKPPSDHIFSAARVIKQSAPGLKIKARTIRRQRELVDLTALIDDMKSKNRYDFVYLTPLIPSQSPYDFRLVPFKEVDRKYFLNISTAGVTTHEGSLQTYFTPLLEWERDYNLYRELSQIRFFRLFRSWKAFNKWRKLVNWKKQNWARDILIKQLFILDSSLNITLVEANALCLSYEQFSFLDISNDESVQLSEFVNYQVAYLSNATEKLQSFQADVVELMTKAFERTTFDEIVAKHQPKEKSESKVTHKKMSYLEQYLRKRLCVKFCRFIYLVSMFLTTLYATAVRNSLRTLCITFQKHIEFIPPKDFLESSVTGALDIPRHPYDPQAPFFHVRLIASFDSLTTSPSEEDFIDTISELTDLWILRVLEIPEILPDSVFYPFTRPIICGKQFGPIVQNGPSLQYGIESDADIQLMRNQCIAYIQITFDSANQYIERLVPMYQFYVENISKSPDDITKETDPVELRHLLETFHSQLNMVQELADKQAMGLILLHFDEFKKEVLPTCSKLLKAVEQSIPQLGSTKSHKLLKECAEATEYLEQDPKLTVEFVAYLKFIDTLSDRLTIIESDVEYVSSLYHIISEFQVPCPNEDIEAHNNLTSVLSVLENLCERKLEERDEIVGRLSYQIGKDIASLNEEVMSIHEEVRLNWLVGRKSNPEECVVTLQLLHDRLAVCQKRASSLRGYQKQFDLEVERFLELEDTFVDLKIRQLLWETFDSWNRAVKEYRHGTFNDLKPDEITTFVSKTLKNVGQVEKMLADNEIISDLKMELNEFKLRIPVMIYLRNSALKARHWLIIESILNRRFPPGESFTLDLLEKCGALERVVELEEIAAQATSEAALESLLKRVESSWQSLEFIVLNHRDSKDVFILGSVEEIEQVLDDSFININTIISSRHVGPIKNRVLAWQRSLDLFSRTLEEWCLCQTDWLYLESIFSTPDIQRQLPIEARLFQNVDKAWKEIMRRTKQNPLAMQAASVPGTLEQLETCNRLIEQIMKCLEAYLESKRVVFPRFYFLSNEELLEILAQTRNPFAVQPHLGKCFDAIHRLEFGGEGVALDILTMISPEGEKVPFAKVVKARGNVEVWLGKVEEIMFMSLKKALKTALMDYDNKPRTSWVLSHPSQTILAASQIRWGWRVHEIFEMSEDRLAAMVDFERENIEKLNELAAIVRGELSPLGRAVICSLITIDVHARDIISQLVSQKITDSTSFEWLKCLRYYWDPKLEDCIVRMSTARVLYGHEYLGASPRLVITPLTDKCYICLMGALQLDLGGAPAGPAGTGKTETTKDLAKALAVQCVVFNCSDSLDYKMMGRFFSGLAQAGAWCCFDEFNRIEVEVLSVIAQQLLTIRNAKVAKVDRFMFEGREIKIMSRCAAFITMNPGYAGRTELPDNLKALFRPISMMIPDYALIAEVILYSEGFVSSKVLAHKMTQMYKLCSEQLSQQNHYDFGMRALKSVLVMAGHLKRANPDVNEDLVLIRALRDSNVPKFLAEDAVLFQCILGDLFPGVEVPATDYGMLDRSIRNVLLNSKLQPEQCIVHKVVQLYETMVVRHGVMLVGPTGGGKTTILTTLKKTLTQLHMDEVKHSDYLPVHTHVMNPKSVTIGELYGEINPATLEWRDGILGLAMRTAVEKAEETHEWIVCDGPVDAVWIENMNTVLDDNKTLCLANSERIRLTPRVRMVFEVSDLDQASPATVSRCGMIYVDTADLQWMPYVKSWIAYEITNESMTDSHKMHLLSLFDIYGAECVQYVRIHCTSIMSQVDLSKVTMICSILQSLFRSAKFTDEHEILPSSRTMTANSFVFAILWAVGGGIDEKSRHGFESFVRSSFSEDAEVRLPEEGLLWDYYMNITTRTFEPWSSMKHDYVYDPAVPFFDILVPTLDTVRFSYLMTNLLSVNKGVLITGNTGVGKSAVAKSVLTSFSSGDEFVCVPLTFSAQTTSARTQEMIEVRLEKKKKAMLGAPVGKRVIVFIDDVNMPALDKYGSQPSVELLRQYLDFGGFYDRENLFWKEICDVIIAAACAPPGGGRNPMTDRFVRHFALVAMPPPSDDALLTIFQAVVHGFLTDFTPAVREIGGRVVSCAVALYRRVAEIFLPTPSKSHYVFNLRDLSKCMQGVLHADSGSVRESDLFLRMFYHECLRCFQDRLNSFEDKKLFYLQMKELCTEHFGTPVIEFDDSTVVSDPPLLIFGDFLNPSASRDERVYEEVNSMDKLKNVLEDCLADFNIVENKNMKLILFRDAVEHCCRVARILRSERGNGLLVGIGGMGKQSITRLASHLSGFRCMQLELTQNYDGAAFHVDLRKVFWKAGVEAIDTAFLITDSQIAKENFLEDISNILDSGEVPNLFEGDELEKMINGLRLCLKNVNTDITREQMIQHFNQRAKVHLRLIIALSPVGESFRRRCRMFPSLVNCCTIDWFLSWPTEALLSVAQDTLRGTVDLDMSIKLSEICVAMHESVDKMTMRLLSEKGRYYYCTPSTYLQLLYLFKEMLTAKTEEVVGVRERFSNGLRKLYETNAVVDTMKAELVAYEPLLVKKSEATTELMKHLAKEQASADHVRQVVLAEEAVAKVKASDTQALADDAQRDLTEAMPAMDSAMKSLDALNKNDIAELKVFNKPPNLVKVVMEAVCLLLGVKQDWATAKILLSDVNFLKRLRDYDKEHMNESMQKVLKAKYIDHPDFVPDKVATQSKVCRSLCMWVRAVDIYARVFKVIEPKRRALDIAETELNTIMGVLREKQRRLAEVEAQIAALESELDNAVAEKTSLEAAMSLTAARLGRSSRLTTALGDEQTRWEQQVEMYTKRLQNMMGDILLSASSVAYLGPFTSDYRRELIACWLTTCQQFDLLASIDFSVSWVLTDAYEIRNWNAFGLPEDNLSVENAVLVTRASRWPLMVDPQGQANRWVRGFEKPHGLRILHPGEANALTHLTSAVRSGVPVLIEDVGETLDSTLEPLLVKQIFTQGGVNMIRLGDSDVEYNKNFRLYMTTKLANPHYLPEICILVTLVNFTVTVTGIEEQLLADIVRLERPDLETSRNELITRINADKQQLKNIEEKILKLLFGATGNILDDEELIDTLNESRETTEVTAARLEETEATEARISTARDRYRSVANRGAVLYYVASQLMQINPMYQNSLTYISKIYCNVLESCEKTEDVDVRVQQILEKVTLALYTNVSRGLFECDKLMFSFLMCTAILLNAGTITEQHWNFFLRGPRFQQMESLDNPYPSLTTKSWMSVIQLVKSFPSFDGLEKDLCGLHISIGDFSDTIVEDTESNENISMQNWNECLTDFEKLMIIKSLKDDLLVAAITEFVKSNLGKNFIECPSINLNELFSCTSHLTPLVFVLSTGSDPFSALQKFAADRGFSSKIVTISLGQGQGPIAEKMITQGALRGEWVFLQNCHLASSWMPQLETKFLSILENPDKIHHDFRLFLSSMPTTQFPAAIIQNAVKVTNEPPRGLRANIKRALSDMSKDFFEDSPLKGSWRRMIFGICFFHAYIQERKNFGPLGWNIPYEFNDSDREVALLSLTMFCVDGTIQWDALEYITGEITYGGRVTDHWDLRCLKTALHKFFSSRILESGYTFSDSGIYYCPESQNCSTLVEYQSYIDGLPLNETATVFGMSENASTVYKIREANSLLSSITTAQQCQSSHAVRDCDTAVCELADFILERISNIDVSTGSFNQIDDKGRIAPLSIVLKQEVVRFNRLLNIVHESLLDLKKGVKGEIVMSENLENTYQSCVSNKVPVAWAIAAYPSLKSLSNWVRDLEHRIMFIKAWLRSQELPSYWLPGLFFPQGFLTAVLQTHARKIDVPIDSLHFHFIVLDATWELETPAEASNCEPEESADGVLVHGLYIESGRWDSVKHVLSEPLPAEMASPLPILRIEPKTVPPSLQGMYSCPLYKTAGRAGVLSTTGTSTNFILPVLLRTDRDPITWILMATALLSQLSD